MAGSERTVVIGSTVGSFRQHSLQVAKDQSDPDVDVSAELVD